MKTVDEKREHHDAAKRVRARRKREEKQLLSNGSECEYFIYTPIRVHTWPHLEKCNEQATRVVMTEEGRKLSCTAHENLWER